VAADGCGFRRQFPAMQNQAEHIYLVDPLGN